MNDSEKEEVKTIIAEAVKKQLDDQRELADDQELARQDDRLSFQELSNTARHYSALRFAMFTVFTTILAALVGLELRQYGSPPPVVSPPPSLVLFFRIAALALAFLFGLLQWRVSDLIVFYQEESDKVGERSPRLKLPLQPGHKKWKYIIRMTMLAPFFLALFFWAWKIITMI
jgi:hypothetical protein